MSRLNVEFQEAEPSRVMCLGCVVDRGIRRLRRHTFSCPLLGVENLGGPMAQLHGGRTFEEAVKFAVKENGRTVRVLVDSWGR